MPQRTAATRSSTVFAVVACIGVVAVVHFAREVLIPFALAILFTFVLAPLVNRLERIRIGRVLSTLMVVFLAFFIIAATSGVVFRQVTDLADQIPRYTDNIKEKIKVIIPGRKGALGKFTRAAEEVNKSIEKAAQEVAVEEAANSQPSAPPSVSSDIAPVEPVPVQVTDADTGPLDVIKSTEPALKTLATAAVVTVLVIFMLLERRSLRDRVIMLAGHNQLNVTTVALEEAGRRISRYLMLQLMVNFLYGLPVGIGLWALGVPNAFLWGLIAMLMRFVPYLGPWIGALPPIILSLAVFDSWLKPSLVTGLFIALELFVNNVLEPRLYGAQAGVSPLALLSATVFWTWIWGPVGLLLAVPITVCVVVIARFVPHLSFITALLTDQPHLDDDARFQQRLLSLDFDEAFEIAEAHCQSHSLLDTYDDIILPTLSQIEQDWHSEMIDDVRVEAVRRGLDLMVSELWDCTESPAQPRPSADRLVLCAPARNEADELAARMLAQLLRARGVAAEVNPVGNLTGELIEIVAERHPRAVCVSALPPSAVGQARHIAMRVVERLPETFLVVGVWDRRQKERLVRRMPASSHVQLVSTLAEAVDALTTCAAECPISLHGP